MLAEIWAYIVALLSNWASLVWGASLIVDVGGLVLRKTQYLAISGWLDQHVAKEETRVSVLRTLLVIGLLIAGFNAWDEQYQIAMSKSPEATVQSEIHKQVDPLKEQVKQLEPLKSEISQLQADNAVLNKQIQNNVTEELASATGLKKSALQLAKTLIDRSRDIMVLATSFGAAPPTQRAEAEKDAAQFLSDYKNFYGNEVVAFRLEFIQRGQFDWKDEQHYLNPQLTDNKDVIEATRQIQYIGFDLQSHANLLN